MNKITIYPCNIMLKWLSKEADKHSRSVNKEILFKLMIMHERGLNYE